jgi:hypothetical protein
VNQTVGEGMTSSLNHLIMGRDRGVPVGRVVGVDDDSDVVTAVGV